MRRGLRGYKCLCLPNFKGSTCSIEITTKKKTKTIKTTRYPCVPVNCFMQYPCVRWGDIQYYTHEDGTFINSFYLFFYNELV